MRFFEGWMQEDRRVTKMVKYRVVWKRAEEIDRFIWPCENCGSNLYEAEVRFDDPGDAVNRATSALKSDSGLATCKKCGERLEV